MNNRFESEENKTEEETSAGQEALPEENGSLPGNSALSEGNEIPAEDVSVKRNEIPPEEGPAAAGEVDARIASYVKEHIRNDGRRRRPSAFRVLVFCVLILIVIFFFVDYALMKRQVVNGWFAKSEEAGETSGTGEDGDTSAEEDLTEPTAGTAEGDTDNLDGEEGKTQSDGESIRRADGEEGSAEANFAVTGSESETGTPAGTEETADPAEIVAQYLVYIEAAEAVLETTEPGNSAWEESRTNVTTGVVVEISQSSIRILTDYESVEFTEAIEITFNGGAVAGAEVETADLNTGLALLVVSVEDISNDTLKEIRTATWGDTAGIGAGTGLLLAATEGTVVSLVNTVILSVGEKKQSDAVFTVYSLDTEMDGFRILADENGDIVAIGTGAGDSMAGSLEAAGGVEASAAYCVDDLRLYIEKMVDGEEIPYVGITGVAVTDEIKEGVSLDMPYGVYVWLAATGSPAYQAGILNGDIITAINGIEITTVQEMRDAILGLEVGVEASFTLMRQGGSTYREYTIAVVPEAVESISDTE